MGRVGKSAAFVAAMALSGDIAMAAGPVPAQVRHPLHVMSLSECTDQLLLALLPPDRIASVTFLSRDPETSQMAAHARRVGINHGLAEEVLRQRPDLVLAGTYTTSSTRALLKRLGWPIIEVPPADTIDQIRVTTRQVAKAVGAETRGETLLGRMDRQLAALRSQPGPHLRVAAWDGAGFSSSSGSLFATLLGLAGADNIGGSSVQRGAPDTETLLAAAPDLIVQGSLTNQHSLRSDTAYNPLVRRFWGADRTLTVRPAYYLCGTPFLADAALRLRDDLRAKVKITRTPLPFAKGPRS